jgi:hypothetical protein
MTKQYLKQYIKEELNRILEMFDKPLPNIEKISDTKYIVGNGQDIEAEYYFQKIDAPFLDKWMVSWTFTKNNTNTSPEAWKQITSTSYKVLSDFIENKHPKFIIISGNTNAKTRLYKSPSFIDKLQDLFNNQYIIDNTSEYAVVMNRIEEIAESSIKKRIETMNESHYQASNYWKNGDLNSKSKIERVNTIKKTVKRTIIEYIYLY